MGDVKIEFTFDLKPFEIGLKNIGAKASGKALGEAMWKAITPVTNTARHLVRKESGLLQKAIEQVVRIYAGAVVGIVGIEHSVQGMWKGRRRIPWFYGHLVEGGARPHALGRSSRLERKSKNKEFIGPGKKGKQKGAMHPGSKKFPFMRPAVELNMSLMEQTFKNTLDDAINSAMK